MKILVYLPRSLGAGLLSIPFLEALKGNFPTSQISLAIPSQFAPLMEVLLPEYQQVPVPIIKDIPTLKVISAKLKKAGFDLGILLDDSFSSALLLLVSRIPERWGYDREGRGFMLTRKLTLKATDPQLHLKDYFLNILKKADLKADSPDFRLKLSPGLIALAEERLAQAGLKSNEPIVIMKPGSSFGKSRVWPVEHQIELIKKLIDLKTQIVLVGSLNSREISQKIAAAFDGRLVDFCGKLTWPEISGLLSLARVFLGNDSGLTHLANILGIPVISLFGPTDPQICGPIFQPAQILKKQVPCSPCSYRVCPYDHRCLNQITADEVLQAVSNFL
ncbi:MAG: lipopolysaccharide heptosyltransferase II [Candidatus Saccharicenans sp.]|nr:MAG: lipopolysaccharide heptosyltransferase II [Candidatus Aminicenantes bacterium]HEK85510.1 lipopolysaccharide heptosyltransferase II [Candidatus Aminicenantes bacterium]